MGLPDSKEIIHQFAYRTYFYVVEGRGAFLKKCTLPYSTICFSYGIDQKNTCKYISKSTQSEQFLCMIHLTIVNSCVKYFSFNIHSLLLLQLGKLSKKKNEETYGKFHMLGGGLGGHFPYVITKDFYCILSHFRPFIPPYIHPPPAPSTIP